MTGKTFIVGNNSEVEISYYLSGKLKGITFAEDVSIGWMNRTIDLIFQMEDVDAMSKHMKAVTKVRVQEIPADISFNRFYEEYNNKVGKQNAERAWKKLSRKNRIKALLMIAKYNAFCTKTKVKKLYPATYLNDGRYNDEVLV